MEFAYPRSVQVGTTKPKILPDNAAEDMIRLGTAIAVCENYRSCGSMHRGLRFLS